MVAQLWELAAWDVASRVRRGEMSAREVIESQLTRIEAVNPQVNAVTVVLADSALDAADGVDRAVLLGLPAVAVPVAEADGLPHAVQIIGPRFREDLCLAAGAAIEAGATCRVPIDPR
jgi:Asp-tRNA(Asn)/Glu-tRNA(Gln) amidotransferase A subunit family amidase